jgi:amino acid permease
VHRGARARSSYKSRKKRLLAVISVLDISVDRVFSKQKGRAQTKRIGATSGGTNMKLIAIGLAVVFVAIAVCYFVIPAGSLPSFFPGFEPQSVHTHMKHGIASLALAVVLLGIAWISGRAKA